MAIAITGTITGLAVVIAKLVAVIISPPSSRHRRLDAVISNRHRLQAGTGVALVADRNNLAGVMVALGIGHKRGVTRRISPRCKNGGCKAPMTIWWSPAWY
jgi:hypothetical protein